MKERKIKLTRRRVLGGIGVIGGASALAGAGTMAYFDDQEESTDNSITAGTLNLTTGSSSDGTSFNISASGLAPGESVEVGYLDLQNTGSINGYLDYELTDITDLENGRNDAEIDAGDGSPNSGELSSVLEIRAFVDETPGNGTRNESISLTSGYVGLSGGRVDTNVQVDAGQTVRIWVDARLPSGAGDVVQSDSVEVDTTFYLDQQQ